MSELRIRRIGYALGAEITGVDLTNLDDATFAKIREAWLEHLLLCFPGQDITKPEFVAFAKRFGGDLDDFSRSKSADPTNKNILFLSSKPEPGQKWDGYKVGLHWHSDRSFADRPATGTFTLAKEIPSVGGDTMFANQYMAYETLSPKMKGIVDNLYCIHTQDNLPNTSAKAGAAVNKEYRNNGLFPPAVHPVAKPHHETGRKALYMGDRVKRFVGMTEEESAPLVSYLNAHAIRYEFLYRHRWSVNDLVVWDNRALMHYAPLDYDPDKEPRFLWRTSLTGPITGRNYDASMEEELGFGAKQPAGV